jgi:hypothetical protein
VTLRAGVFVIVAVSYIAVRVSDECQKDEDRNCNYSIHQRRDRQLAVLDEWSFTTFSKQCQQLVLLGISYFQNNLDAGLTRAAN